MLNNRWVQIGAVVALVGAIGYNVWFFVLQGDDEPAPTPAGGGGESPAAVTTEEGGASAVPDSALRSVGSLFVAGEDRTLPLRNGTDLETVRNWRQKQPEWGRDPFRLEQLEVARADTAMPDTLQPPDWNVTSILQSSDTRIATINGELYWEGDRLGQGRIVDIGDEEVVVRWLGQNITLDLPREGQAIEIQTEEAASDTSAGGG